MVDERDAVEARALGYPCTLDDLIDTQLHLRQKEEPLGHDLITLSDWEVTFYLFGNAILFPNGFPTVRH
ncbi:hypothetical protein MAUB_14060 [Mycolicibacterium aubagnense]|uniref:Uncharacterized protein n=1 Tax=Mycolicibacterium aubagnense TaxID=319707 RepID=A0ABM7IA65_9MYCO|nr:hypothetical protein MAUB_14060 [Mycolicibacterium aubagnense]